MIKNARLIVFVAAVAIYIWAAHRIGVLLRIRRLADVGENPDDSAEEDAGLAARHLCWRCGQLLGGPCDAGRPRPPVLRMLVRNIRRRRLPGCPNLRQSATARGPILNHKPHNTP